MSKIAPKINGLLDSHPVVLPAIYCIQVLKHAQQKQQLSGKVASQWGDSMVDFYSELAVICYVSVFPVRMESPTNQTIITDQDVFSVCTWQNVG